MLTRDVNVAMTGLTMFTTVLLASPLGLEHHDELAVELVFLTKLLKMRNLVNHTLLAATSWEWK